MEHSLSIYTVSISIIIVIFLDRQYIFDKLFQVLANYFSLSCFRMPFNVLKRSMGCSWKGLFVAEYRVCELSRKRKKKSSGCKVTDSLLNPQYSKFN